MSIIIIHYYYLAIKNQSLMSFVGDETKPQKNRVDVRDRLIRVSQCLPCRRQPVRSQQQPTSSRISVWLASQIQPLLSVLSENGGETSSVRDRLTWATSPLRVEACRSYDGTRLTMLVSGRNFDGLAP
jgi:hypothetical protein